jgi:ribosome maturation factor RimP
VSNRTEDQAKRIVIPFLEQNDCLLWDVIFEKEGAMHYLRILFDSKDGFLDMDKCERLTLPLNKLLDEQEFIKQVDIVEIGSPGITRRLRHKEHFEFCMGKSIRILRRLDNGKTESVSGILNGYNEKNKTISLATEFGSELRPDNELSLKKCIRITLNQEGEQLQ